jgi:hypothetical protein
VIELSLATLVLLNAAIEFFGLSQPYPAWPTVGPVPVDPELIIPGLLGIVAILVAIREGIAIGSIVVGVLGMLTLWIAATSLYSLYADTAGGLFWGGFVTLISGTFLAIAVIVQSLVRHGN